jgi:hypothetical protein
MPPPGKYSGSILGADGKAATALELHVKHPLVAAIAILLIGLAIAFVADSWVLGLRPSLSFNEQIGRLRDQATKDAAAERRRLMRMGPRALVNPAVPVTVYAAGRGSWLATEVGQAIGAFERAVGGDQESTGETQITALLDILASQRLLWNTGDSIRDTYWSVHDRMPDADRKTLEHGRIPFLIREALQGRVLQNKPEYDATVEAWGTHLASIRGLNEVVDEIRSLQTAGVPMEDIDAAFGGLASLRELAGDDTTKLEASVSRLWSKVPSSDEKQQHFNELVDQLRGGQLEQKVARDEDVVRELRKTASSGRITPDRARPGSDVANILSTLVHAPPERLRRIINAVDVVYYACVVLIAVLGGLATNYFGKDTFGTGSDYANLLIVGFVGIEIQFRSLDQGRGRRRRRACDRCR